MSDDGTVSRYYPNLALGQQSSAPPRSMDPQGGGQMIWRNSLNFLPRDNLLQRRGGITPWAFQPAAGSTNAPLNQGECPLIILTESNSSSSDFMAVITTRQILLYPNTATGWVNMTPRYGTGTVSINNGSTAVTGIGTAWQTRFITAGQRILLQGSYYTISSVNNDLSITIASAYTGTNLVAAAYWITRNWLEEVSVSFGGYTGIRVAPDCEITAVLFNESLYVAGSRLAGADGTARPAVIKVSSVFSNSPTVTYITARDALQAGLDVISGLSRIAGIQTLQDGRVVMIGNSNTVFYSSHLNDAVWTTSPAGQVNITLCNGKLNALGRVGNNLTLHGDEEIILGYPTGLSDPPLKYQLSSARVGCSYYRTLKSFGEMECFVSSDFDAVMFDGGSVTSLGGGELRKKNTTSSSRTNRSGIFANIDAWRREYRVFGVTGPPTSGGGVDCTIFDVYSFETSSWWPCQVGFPVTGGSDTNETYGSAPSSRGFFGITSIDNGTVKANMVYTWDDALGSDPTAFSHAAHGPIYVETDDLDFGQPLAYKTIQLVIVWLSRMPLSGTSEAFTVSASVDQGNTFVDVSETFTYGAYPSMSIPIQSCFDPSSPGAGTTVRIRISWSGSGAATVLARPERMLLVAQLGGDIRTVEL